jgi:hypothetical protein
MTDSSALHALRFRIEAINSQHRTTVAWFQPGTGVICLFVKPFRPRKLFDSMNLACAGQSSEQIACEGRGLETDENSGSASHSTGHADRRCGAGSGGVTPVGSTGECAENPYRMYCIEQTPSHRIDLAIPSISLSSGGGPISRKKWSWLAILSTRPWALVISVGVSDSRRNSLCPKPIAESPGTILPMPRTGSLPGGALSRLSS